jgi:cytidine deaminase
MDNLSRREAMALATASAVMVAANAESWAAETQVPIKQEQVMAEPDNQTLQEMAKRAKAISEKAYCPYSKFRVGAVILTDDGHMVDGCNVENASYGLTICAERNAVFQMVADGRQKIVAVVIYTPTPKPSAPCGACRQVINEFGPDALIISLCDGSDVLKNKLSELLPNAFGPANLS